MKIEIQAIIKPSVSIKLDGKEFKLTEQEANELANKLNVLLDKGCKGNPFPQIIYVDRYIQQQPMRPYWGTTYQVTSGFNQVLGNV